jgi:hypothetical protein
LAAQLAALGYFTVTACIPQPWLSLQLARVVTAEISQNKSKYQFASDNCRTEFLRTTAARYKQPIANGFQWNCCLPANLLQATQWAGVIGESGSQQRVIKGLGGSVAIHSTRGR